MGLKTYLKERLTQYIESKVWQRFFDLNIRLEQQNKLIEQLASENCQQREQLVNLSLEFEKSIKVYKTVYAYCVRIIYYARIFMIEKIFMM